MPRELWEPGDLWDPAQYERFRAERERPADDLLAMVEPVPGGRVIDLGCGTGAITARLHRLTQAAETLGVDRSARMLERAAAHAMAGLRFEEADLLDPDGVLHSGGPLAPGAPPHAHRWDVVFANASLQWLADHEALLPRLVALLTPTGQLAFQVPANFDHPSHVVADQIGRQYGLEPLRQALDVCTPARYAEILWAAGLEELDVSMRIYGVALPRTDDVVAWVSSTLLTRFEAELGPDDFASFRDEYRSELLARLGDPAGDQPYFYAFPRILCRGRRCG